MTEASRKKAMDAETLRLLAWADDFLDRRFGRRGKKD